MGGRGTIFKKVHGVISMIVEHFTGDHARQK